MAAHTPHIDAYLDALEHARPDFTPEEQRAGLTLYRQLALGQPVGLEPLAAALNVSLPAARELFARPSLKRFMYRDEHGRVIGFGGLTIASMPHKFTVNGRALRTWCAWDTLFIPELLGETAHVESPDPDTGEIVRLEVSPNGVTAVEPDGVVVSFLMPDPVAFAESADVIAKFCHFVFFFASRTSGERWVAKHPGTFLYSLADATTIARGWNARSFGAALAEQASHAA